ncbi:unnamed protein product [Phyllotreta striolata]|uniref:Uncharacterized protein n=1 Tax=Phyllotreta striolata TaxID=444603 RepID=A0A9N9XP13_PHYSR|nr:unnamed protein product [Phyllotreta striolata]
MYFHSVVLTLLVLCGLVYSQNQGARIVKYENDVRGNGGYNFRFETDDPVARQEAGTWEGTGTYGPDGEELGYNRVNGNGFHYFPDGTPFRITYTANEYGYQPKFVIGNVDSKSKIPDLRKIPDDAYFSLQGGGLG